MYITPIGEKMKNTLANKKPSDCTIMIVDDEKIICDFLCEALGDSYKVISAQNTQEAMSLLDTSEIDVVITDLKLPDGSGIDILRHAKACDKFIEVVIMTGFATVDSAAKAINLGASLYLIKPINLEELIPQIERTVNNRVFHLKSVVLMTQPGRISAHVKEHLFDITTLYHFSRKLMLSFEIPEVLRIILEEINERLGAVMSSMTLNILDFSEAFAMPLTGEIAPALAKKTMLDHWEAMQPVVDRIVFERDEIPFTLYNGKQGSVVDLTDLKPVTIPMMVMGRTIGSFTVFLKQHTMLNAGQNQFFFVFASLVTPIVEHGYLDMQSRLQAKTDNLTGVANHRMFHETLSREISRANRAHSDFGLIILDIDNFKSINDTFGHLVGDAVLKDLTLRINKSIRIGDLLSRFGGDEFAIILPDTDLKGSTMLAQRICREITTHPFVFAQTPVEYSVSLGVAVYSGKIPSDKNRLIATADKALYQSKSSGKNRVSIL